MSQKCKCGCGELVPEGRNSNGETLKYRPGHLRKRPVDKRFWAKVQKTDTCWLWNGQLRPLGYGTFWTGERGVAAHRFAYELVVGPIPEGLVIDHLCRNSRCVNPDHLEPVTPTENVRRGNKALLSTLRAKERTHCRNGHLLDAANAFSKPEGGRGCRICQRMTRQRAYLARVGEYQRGNIRRTFNERQYGRKWAAA